MTKPDRRSTTGDGSKTPTHVKRATDEFFAANKIFPRQIGLGQSPLSCFGYRVGRSIGRAENIRREILEYTMRSCLPKKYPLEYRRKWGAASTHERYEAICNHLDLLVARHKGNPSMNTAVAEWKADRAWFKGEFSQHGQPDLLDAD